MTERRVSAGGVSIALIDTGGDGPAVVLLHGRGMNHRMWDPQLASLGSALRLIAIDLPGFGASDRPPDIDWYSAARYAEVIEGLMEALLGDGGGTLVGFSLGGFPALELLRRGSGAVRGALLYATRVVPDPPERAASWVTARDGVLAGETPPLGDNWPAVLLGEDPTPEAFAAAAHALDDSRIGAAGAIETVRTRPDLRTAFGDVQVPVGIVHGTQDQVIDPAEAAAVAACIPGADVRMIERAGHLANIEAPNEFDTALLALVRRVDARAPMQAGSHR
jgi:pimeloyl-ACP methyl ester carboxylesterase